MRPSDEIQLFAARPTLGKSKDAIRLALQAAATAVAETPIARNNYTQFVDLGDAHATRSACVAAVRRIDPGSLLDSSGMALRSSSEQS